MISVCVRQVAQGRRAPEQCTLEHAALNLQTDVLKQNTQSRLTRAFALQATCHKQRWAFCVVTL